MAGAGSGQGRPVEPRLAGSRVPAPPAQPSTGLNSPVILDSGLIVPRLASPHLTPSPSTPLA